MDIVPLLLVAGMAVLYGCLADHFYTIWRDGHVERKLSRCDECGHRLTWEMTPVLGYIAVRGRCWRKDCGLVVPPTYPLVEVAGVLVGIVAAAIALRAATSIMPFFAALIGEVLISYVAGVGAALALHRIAPPRGAALK